ncbi:MAG: DUF1120 domain-containing protein [Pseudomonas sp.]|jgi:hypothetical protein|uniref:DUF1120 domain-containing protein n=1 Tax=Pseudomonas sp. TaxID=306 RepID=UPI0012014F41|nr:DUF1120 domain-containing protein [Pseudomonas sp.]RZI70889.1 MAG: DUF1120 domain-containing protein [Pseudomonas sp.]
MFKRSLIAGAVLSVSLGAHAVGANISVTGTVTPDACTIALGNNGNVDYGTLTASVVRSYDLWFGTHYTLPNKDIAIEVNCPSATRVGLSVLDNRATTKENGLTRPGIKFGLGLSGTQPIGFYEIQTHSIQIGLTRGGTPNNAGSSLIRDMSGGPWIYQSSDVPSGYLSQLSVTSFSTGTTRTAQLTPITRLSGTLRISTKVSTRAIDGLVGNLSLAGATTIQMVYV